MMDFLQNEGVVTTSIQEKIHKLSSLQNDVAAVNCDIKCIKDNIATIKHQRIAAAASLNAQIKHTRAVLRSRQQRRQRLERELTNLKVQNTFACFYMPFTWSES